MAVMKTEFIIGCARRIALSQEIERKTKDLEVVENKRQEVLVKNLPPFLKDYLIEENVIKDIFVYRIASRKIRYDSCDEFSTSKKVKKIFKDLQKTWNGSVVITIETSSPHRATIYFKLPEKVS